MIRSRGLLEPWLERRVVCMFSRLSCRCIKPDELFFFSVRGCRSIVPFFPGWFSTALTAGAKAVMESDSCEWK